MASTQATMVTVERLMAQAPVFAGLPPAHLQAISGCGRRRRVHTGAVLVREGELAETFFLICEGSVALEISSPARGASVITTLHAGELLGWSWLFEPYRWRIDGRAVQPTMLIAFDGPCVRALCEADHELVRQPDRRLRWHSPVTTTARHRPGRWFRCRSP